jgi:hypothetical protein
MTGKSPPTGMILVVQAKINKYKTWQGDAEMTLNLPPPGGRCRRGAKGACLLTRAWRSHFDEKGNHRCLLDLAFLEDWCRTEILVERADSLEERDVTNSPSDDTYVHKHIRSTWPDRSFGLCSSRCVERRRGSALPETSPTHTPHNQQHFMISNTYNMISNTDETSDLQIRSSANVEA